jgi:hypothetical protein
VQFSFPCFLILLSLLLVPLKLIYLHTVLTNHNLCLHGAQGLAADEEDLEKIDQAYKVIESAYQANYVEKREGLKPLHTDYPLRSQHRYQSRNANVQGYSNYNVEPKFNAVFFPFD